MASMANDIQQILDLAPQYSRDATPAMLQREAAGRDIAQQLGHALADLSSELALRDLHLDARAGGRQAKLRPARLGPRLLTRLRTDRAARDIPGVLVRG